MNQKISFVLILFSIIYLTSCATIVGDSTQLLPIKSSPSGASIVVIDEKGSEIFNEQSPTIVTLRKSDGSYWGGQEYTVRISKEGHKAQSFKITSSVNGWYIAGNLIFGGLIGWFIVDPFSGGMYTLSPKELDPTLAEKISHYDTDEGLTIVLLEDVPVSLRSHLKKIN